MLISKLLIFHFFIADFNLIPFISLFDISSGVGLCEAEEEEQ